MAQRRQKHLLEILATAPWWLSVIVAVVVYVACKIAPSIIHSESPLFAAVNVLVGVLSRNAHFVALPFLIVAALAALNGLRRRRLLERQSGIESIRDLSWQDFELLVGEAYRRQGYAVEENGGGGADGGVDLRLRRDGKVFLVQCKRWKQRQVPVTAVRELYGLMAAEKASGAFFVSSGTFTADAQRFAADNGIVLVDGDSLLDLIGKPGAAAPFATPTTVPTVAAAPSCPACGSQMVRRTAKRGENAGQSFWGCSTFPRCRGTIASEA